MHGRLKNLSPSVLFVGMRVGPVMSREFARQAFDDSSDAVYSMGIVPADDAEAWEFLQFGSHQYRLEVRVDASGIITRLAVAGDGGRASNELEWADLAPSAQEAIFYELMRLTGELVELEVAGNSDGLGPDESSGDGGNRRPG